MNNLPEIKNPLTNGKIIKTDCPIKEYLDSKGDENQPILSRGDLCEISTCPARWQKGYQEPDRRVPAVEFGSLFDCLLLQPERFDEYYMTAPTEYTNSKKQVVPWTWKSSTCRDWREEQEFKGFLVCSDEDLLDAAAAVKALREHPDLGKQTCRLLKQSQHQVFVISEYHDENTGLVVPVKCLTDIVPDVSDGEFGKSLFDLKTARSAHPAAWTKAVFEGDYHVQAAINLDCHNAIAGSDRCDFRHLIVENFAPWEPARRFITQEFITLGRLKYLKALQTYCQCVESGRWPTYHDPAAMVLLDGYEATSPLPWMVGRDA